MPQMKSIACVGILLVSAALFPVAALAKSPPPPLPTCLNGLGSEVQRIVSPLLPGAIVSGTLTTTIVPAAAAIPVGRLVRPRRMAKLRPIVWSHSRTLRVPRDCLQRFHRQQRMQACRIRPIALGRPSRLKLESHCRSTRRTAALAASKVVGLEA